MPIEMNMKLSDDRLTAEIELPDTLGTLKLKADELTEFIYHLAWVRASMLPQHPRADLTPETQTSLVPAVRWSVTEDDVEGQARLYVLHPGFGWLYMALHQPSFDDMTAKLRAVLRRLRKK